MRHALLAAIIFGVVAVAGAAHAGLALAAPRDAAYDVSLLSSLAADYRPWPETGPRQGALDEAVIEEAARDAVLRAVAPPLDGELVPVELPPLPRAAAPGEPRPGAVQVSPGPSNAARPPTLTATSVESAPPVAQAPNRATAPAATATPAGTVTPPAAAPPTAVPPGAAPAVPSAAPAPPAVPPSAPAPEPSAAPSAAAPLELPTEALVPSEVPTELVPPAPVATATPWPSDTVSPPPTATSSAAPRPAPTATAVPPTPTRPVAPTAAPPPAPSQTATSLVPTDPPPAPTATPTDQRIPPPSTQVPPTDTPEPPTDTPEPPTDTPEPPTDTPVPPTDTPEPPTDTPEPPTDTPEPPTDTPVPPTDTPVPLSLFVAVTEPSDGSSIGAAPRIEAVAYDPNLGSTNGQGISTVLFTITDAGGSVVHSAGEGQASYCAFGGNSACSAWPFGQWNALPPGAYTITVEAVSSQGLPSVTASVTFTKLP